MAVAAPSIAKRSASPIVEGISACELMVTVVIIYSTHYSLILIIMYATYYMVILITLLDIKINREELHDIYVGGFLLIIMSSYYIYFYIYNIIYI